MRRHAHDRVCLLARRSGGGLQGGRLLTIGTQAHVALKVMTHSKLEYIAAFGLVHNNYECPDLCVNDMLIIYEG
jgi:hypothetical protein